MNKGSQQIADIGEDFIEGLSPDLLKILLQNFTSASDFDWSKSVDEIDGQLNLKYKLNADEIDFIRTHVRAMD